MVGSALSKKAVARIYKLRKRNLKKPMIILISSFEDLDIFGIRINRAIKKILKKFWPASAKAPSFAEASAGRSAGKPGAISIILPCWSKKFSYLHRGTKSLAFRLPAKKVLVNLLKKTGPLVAPSANPEGLPPAKTIKEAKKYFGNRVDFYIDAGKLVSSPSTLIAIKNNQIIIKRPGN